MWLIDYLGWPLSIILCLIYGFFVLLTWCTLAIASRCAREEEKLDEKIFLEDLLRQRHQKPQEMKVVN